MARGLGLWLLAAVAAGCGETAIERGARRFREPAFSGSPANVFSCATCHSVERAGDPGRQLPGYTLHGAAARPSWWGGKIGSLREAVSECLVEFMRGRDLPAEDADGRAIYVYLRSLAPDGAAPALPLTIVANIADLPAGEAGRGAGVYGRACAACHGDAHTGRGRLGPRISIVPEDTLATFGRDPLTGARLVTIEKVRHGKFFNVGGVMPPFAAETISDGEVSDLLAYLGL